MIEAQQKCQLCTIFITSKIEILGNGVCVYLNGYKLFFRTNKIIPKSLTGEELWYKAHDYINFNETVTLMVPGAGEDCYENFLNDGTQSTRLNDFKNNCIRIIIFIFLGLDRGIMRDLIGSVGGTVIVVNWKTYGLACCGMAEFMFW